MITKHEISVNGIPVGTLTTDEHQIHAYESKTMVPHPQVVEDLFLNIIAEIVKQNKAAV